ncbi:hypothetical protein NC652_000782 [Populus alba x Populus x berolinensis]|nr:hypothetical protein NC652_000782 [Populus alba x Populus x berolinensis]
MVRLTTARERRLQMLMSPVEEVGWLAEAAGGVSVTMCLRGGFFMTEICVVEAHRRYGSRQRRERLVFGLKMKGGSG